MAKVWFEDDEFWEIAYPFMFGEDRWTAALREVEELIQLLSLKPSMAILDLGCGPGRHAVELAKRGHAVTGVDRTPFLLNKAKEHARANHVEVEFVLDDMRNFQRPNTFDTVLSLFTSFGFFKDPDEDKKVAENMYQSLKQGGKVAIDVMGSEMLQRIFQPESRKEIDGNIFITQRSVNKDWTWIENKQTYIKGRRKKEINISHRLYRAPALQDLLRGVGFSDTNAYGSFTGTPYDDKATRLVVVGVK
jgi:cyclopropane fatty-acyl-phospholipid synthase-like methyltransferase